MADGKGCTCHAYSESECCCDADWTPQIVYDQKEEIEELRGQLAASRAREAKLREMLAECRALNAGLAHELRSYNGT